MLEFVNKTETNKEIEYIKKIIDTNETYTLKTTNQSVEKRNSNNIILMNLRRASPAVSLTFMFYSDTETIQAASLHVSFGTHQSFVLDS